ncbi:uncharacterized protein LY89DRAFT_196587 [Mollisia scopiformis]|uniref:Uncharacterized protein n=1 Tax=Mollisia scopiformis TaxID=149040 RepID=A0A194WZ71_MOLSC|nr:uncharacterized protein LY89DRAFT_196587 [Mollisia scopiformis]KUJ12897.1 hypothetical protein LY89DRAFT_196587 [Mollisia scopiformis]
MFQATKYAYAFHISWTELCREQTSDEDEDMSQEVWVRLKKSYGTIPGDWLTTKSYTIQAFPPRQMRPSKHFSEHVVHTHGWTLLLLTCSNSTVEVPKPVRDGFTRPWNQHERTEWAETQEFQSPILHLYARLDECLLVRSYFDNLSADVNSLLASIDCFRVLDRLRDVVPRLEHAIEEWKEWQQHHINRDSLRANPFVIATLDEIDASVQVIEKLRQDFDTMGKRAESMNTAIFNLTSVKEARESRCLNENVRLLTYATVFFLPLSFCTSMWSINDMFGSGIKGFAIVTTIFAIITYAIITYAIITYAIITYAIITYAIIAILLSPSTKKATHRLGRRMWKSTKDFVAGKTESLRKRKTKTKDQEREVVSEVMDPEKAA